VNRLLDRLRAEFIETQDRIRSTQDRAADDGRDLDDAEQANVDAWVARCTELKPRIESLVAQEQGFGAVADTLARVGAADGDPTPVARGGAVVRRDDPIYRPDGATSFFADLYRAGGGDRAALDRLQRHELQTLGRTAGDGTLTGSGAGIVQPAWLNNLYAPDPKGGRPLANTFLSVPISSADPFYLPYTKTASTVDTQSAEHDVPATGAWETDKLTITPSTVAGKQKISRQLLDGASPAVDALLAMDLMGEYDEKVEAIVAAALLATSGATTGAIATGGGELYVNAIEPAKWALFAARKAAATMVVIGTTVASSAFAATGSDGRPLVPYGLYGPTNAAGVNGNADRQIAGLPVVVSHSITDKKVVVARNTDLVLCESPVQRFRFDQPSGPESIEMSVWGYVAAVTTRFGGKSVWVGTRP
jgi:HK97 family phage major capsid protein